MVRRAAAALFLALFSAAPAPADEVSEALLRGYFDWVDSSPEWSASVSLVRSEGSDTYAEGLVFSRTDPNISISIETLRLGRLEARDGGGFRATRVDMIGAAIAAKDLRYTIPSATVADVSIPEMPGLDFDPHRLMTLSAQAYSALARAELSNLSIPQMTGVSERSSVETGDSISTRLVYRDLAIDELKTGIAAGLRAGPISLRVAGRDGETEVEVQSVRSERMDVDAFAHVFDPANYAEDGGDRVWRSISSNVICSGLSVSAPGDFTLAVDRLQLEGLEGRQLDEPFTQVWDKLLDLAVPEEEKPGFVLDLIRSYAAWRLGGLSMEGLEMSLGAAGANLSAAELDMGGVSGDGIDSLVLQEVDGQAPEGFLRLGSLELEGFVSPDLDALMAFAALEPDIDAQMHAQAIAKTFAAFPRLSHFGAHDVAMGESEANAYVIADFTIDLRLWNEIFAEATDMRLAGLKLDPDFLGPNSVAMLDALGYDELVLGIALSDRWTPETGSYAANWTFSLTDGGDLDLSYALSGLTRDWLVRATAAAGESEDSEDAFMAMIDDLRLHSATLSFTDRSLLERAFGYAAQIQDLDVDGGTYREQMRSALPFLISAAMPPAITKLLTKPLQQFLSGGQKIIAEIEPATPLNMTDLLAEGKDPLALPDRLNMKLRAEAPSE